MLVQSPEPEREGKTGVPEENLSGKDENQQETQHTYDSESGNLPRATLVRGGGGGGGSAFTTAQSKRVQACHDWLWFPR